MNTASHTPACRRGFTLMEMLLVVGIIVVLATILVPVSLRLTERSNVSNGIAQLQGYLAQAKARAVAEKKPQGIRLLAMSPEQRTTSGGVALPWYDRVEFIEAPGNYNEGFIWAVLPKGAPHVIRVPTWIDLPATNRTFVGVDLPSEFIGYEVPVSFQLPNVVYGPFWRLVAGMPTSAIEGMGFTGGGLYPPLLANRKQFMQFDFAGSSDITQPMAMHVMAGDVLEINGISQPYLITAVERQANTNPASGVVWRPSRLFLDRPLPHDIAMPVNGQPNYRIIRQPRTIPNTPTVKLAGEVVVDLTPPTNFTSLTNFDRDQNNQIWMRGVGAGLDISFPGKAFPPSAPPGSVQFAPRAIELMFNEAGQLIPNSRSFSIPSDIRLSLGISQQQYFESYTVTGDGIVYLWLHPAANVNAWASGAPSAADGNADNQGLISINTRTGAIGSYRINQDAAVVNPWQDAQRGRAQGVGGM